MLILIVVFVGVVGGVTFISQLIDRPTPASLDNDSKTAPRVAHLTFAHTEHTAPVACEVAATGHQDFWFKNPYAEPVEIEIDFKSCKCTDVAVLPLTAAEVKQVPAWPPAESAHQVAGHVLEQAEGWQRLGEGDVVTVPAAGAGAIRVNWKAKQPGVQLIRAVLQTQIKGEAASRADTSLEQNLLVLSPVEVQPTKQQVPDLLPGTERGAEFLCWSLTRKQFHVEAKEETGDAHVRCTATPLTEKDLRQLREKIGPKAPVPLSGYKLHVAVREVTADGKHMDLGVFTRRIVVSGDFGSEGRLSVNGMVRGDIQVGTSEDGRLDLGKFAAAEGCSKTVPLETPQTGFDLGLESYFPPDLEVYLGKGQAVDGGKRWELTVTARPNLPSGPLPPESIIVLKTTEKTPRHLRIPVRGAAYR